MNVSGKKQNKTVQPAASREKLDGGRTPVFSFSFKIKCIVLCSICFLFYANSIPNKYAFDDTITIEANAYVQMGFAGIPKILTNDSYASYYTYSGGDPAKQLAGGRFRPLSEITFAIEQQLFGDSEILPYFRHLINVLAYMACILAIFYFLENFLFKKIPGGNDMAFVATLLFAIHPLHTEVVANIKSLDEILSMLFIMLTFIYSLQYLKSRQMKHLTIGCCSFFLALLSKEYAITLLFFIPFLFYLLEGKNVVTSITSSLPYYGVFVVYLLLRQNAVGLKGSGAPSPLLLDNPYLYATHLQKVATEWFVLGKYIGLLFFPYPLACDYSYNQIPYHNFSDVTVIFSIIIYIGIIIWGTRLALKKNILSFAVLFFVLNILMISNFVLDIGATMGERLVFHSSLGFVIILSYYFVRMTSKMTLPAKKGIIMGVLSAIGVVCLGETVIRNAQWKDETSLFVHDASVVPNSCLVDANAGWGYISLCAGQQSNSNQSKAYLDSAHKYLLRALHFNPKYEKAYLNLGDVYYYKGLIDSARYVWDMAKELDPNDPLLKTKYPLLPPMYFSIGMSLGQNQGKPREGIAYLVKGLSIDTANATMWYNLGGAYFTIHNYDSARYAWTKALQYQPGNANAKRGLAALGAANAK